LTAKNRSFIDALWDFCCSLKLTVVSLILLAATSIIGTVIQQNRDPSEYLQLYGETTYRIFEALQLFDMYHSWWFLTLLALFALNLTACSIKRFPRVWRMVRQPVLTPEDSHYRTLSNMEEVVTKDSPENLRDKLAAVIKENFSAPTITEKDGRIHLYAEKGSWSRFGVYVTHISILVIFLGAIIGNVFGYKAFVSIVEGSEADQVWLRGTREPVDLGFTLRCESFSVTYYEGSMRPKEFKSLITVVENGEEVIKDRPVIVNDPLKHNGIVFYQSSYGPAGDPFFTFEVTERASGESQTYRLRKGQRQMLPGGASFRVADFAPSFQNFGPAARVDVMPTGSSPRSFTVLKNFPQFDQQRGGDYIFNFVDYKQRQYTGLQVAKDPGVWVVWAGCLLLVVGSMVAFFLSHRRIWVTIRSLDGKSGIMIGGSAHRNQPAFEGFFDDFKKKLREEVKGS